MKREIEFRIWDIDDKHFLSLDDFQKMGCVMINNDGTLFLSSDYRFMLNMMIKLDKYTIQQYTGLKDKNGKKIFEGDIIIAHDTKFIVKFGAYKTKLFGKEYGSAIRTKQFGWYAESIENKEQCNLVTPNDIEVIGNIYENNLESKGD